MGILRERERVRNATKARNSFVTRRAESKISALADFFRLAAGENWRKTVEGRLQRRLEYEGFLYLNSLSLIYNWENRFMSVNYNLQMLAELKVGQAMPEISAFAEHSEAFMPAEYLFKLSCTQKLFNGKRRYSWNVHSRKHGDAENARSEEYFADCRKRLQNPLILERLEKLDILELEIKHEKGGNRVTVSCESIIGSAAWILIPPVFSMVTPKLKECVNFYELFELLGDAVTNPVNRGEIHVKTDEQRISERCNR